MKSRTLAACSLLGVVGLAASFVFSTRKMGEIPSPFSSLRGDITAEETSSANLRPVQYLDFSGPILSQPLERGVVSILRVPEGAVPPIAKLNYALTPDTKVFGYKYATPDASVEIAAKARASSGVPVPFAELFPGTFFASPEEMVDPTSVMHKMEQKGVHVVTPSATDLDPSGRYIVIANDRDVRFDLAKCGNGICERTETAEQIPGHAGPPYYCPQDCAPSLSSSSSSSESLPIGETCSIRDCGAMLQVANIECPNGSLAGPVCKRVSAGHCDWVIRHCEEPGSSSASSSASARPIGELCNAERCGAPPPAHCLDGSTATNKCIYAGEGQCSWSVQCAAEHTSSVSVSSSAPAPDIKTCGGFMGTRCPFGFICVDNPHDNCSAENGGADCIGICVPHGEDGCGPSPLDCAVGWEQVCSDGRWNCVHTSASSAPMNDCSASTVLCSPGFTPACGREGWVCKPSGDAPKCGDGISGNTPGEECDYGVQNGQFCDSVINGTCTYCSSDCKNIVVGGH